jgi:hypothetical protein
MNIINSSNQFLQIVAPVFPRKVHKLLVFGYRALSLQRIQSVNSNARSTVANAKTAESKAYRIGLSKLLRAAFPKLIRHLSLVHDDDIIAVDFSDFGLVQVLMFAKQTHSGRALPVWFAVLPYNWTEEKSQNTFIMRALDEFRSVVGCKVSFVFDRGFAVPDIVEQLCAAGVVFYLRIRGDKNLLGRKGKAKGRQFGAGCHAIWAYYRRLNLVVTPEPDVRMKTSGKAKEPWYIVTNDLGATAEQVVDIYYHRFEIEEVFKDAKRLFGLEWIKFKIPERLVTVLWFVILGFWLHRYLEATLQASREVVQKTKGSFGQGLTHYWLEKIRFELGVSALAAINLSTA